jgi:hypothetical protein
VWLAKINLTTDESSPLMNACQKNKISPLMNTGGTDKANSCAPGSVEHLFSISVVPVNHPAENVDRSRPRLGSISRSPVDRSRPRLRTFVAQALLPLSP